MNRKVALAAAAASIVTAFVTALAARHHYYAPPEDDGSIARVVDSRILGERRDVIVHLPEGYARDRARRYPVLYVLDGGSQAGHTADSARLLARIGLMPAVIVIGVPSSGENRARDYTPPYMEEGKADRFLGFLETELIPHIDRTYRTIPQRMLAGWSRGGLFVVYSLLERPDLFAARFAHSPALWRDDGRILREIAKARPSGFLYLSLGDRENEKMTRAFRKVTRELQTSAFPELRWRADITKGADHQNNPVLATPVGLHAWTHHWPKIGSTVAGVDLAVVHADVNRGSPRQSACRRSRCPRRRPFRRSAVSRSSSREFCRSPFIHRRFHHRELRKNLPAYTGPAFTGIRSC